MPPVAVAQAASAGGFRPQQPLLQHLGGNPVSAAAGLAVLRTVQQEGLMQNAGRVGAYLRERLRDWPRVMISSAM